MRLEGLILSGIPPAVTPSVDTNFQIKFTASTSGGSISAFANFSLNANTLPTTGLSQLTYEYRDDRMVDISLGIENFVDAEGDEILFELYQTGN